MNDSNSTLVGKIIDSPIEDFKKSIVVNNMPLGMVNNLSFTLSSVYSDLVNRKEMIVQGILKGTFSKEDELVNSALKGIYAEMAKIEQKMQYLNERSKELTHKLV